MEIDYKYRIGYFGSKQLKYHPLFDKVDWEEFSNKKLKPPGVFSDFNYLKNIYDKKKESINGYKYSFDPLDLENEDIILNKPQNIKLFNEFKSNIIFIK